MKQTFLTLYCAPYLILCVLAALNSDTYAMKRSANQEQSTNQEQNVTQVIAAPAQWSYSTLPQDLLWHVVSQCHPRTLLLVCKQWHTLFSRIKNEPQIRLNKPEWFTNDRSIQPLLNNDDKQQLYKFYIKNNNCQALEFVVDNDNDARDNLRCAKDQLKDDWDCLKQVTKKIKLYLEAKTSGKHDYCYFGYMT